MKRSVKESIYNIVWGFAGSVVLNWVYLKATDYEPQVMHMTGLAILMTIWSFIRSFAIRRWMNRGDGEGR